MHEVPTARKASKAQSTYLFSVLPLLGRFSRTWLCCGSLPPPSGQCYENSPQEELIPRPRWPQGHTWATGHASGQEQLRCHVTLNSHVHLMLAQYLAPKQIKPGSKQLCSTNYVDKKHNSWAEHMKHNSRFLLQVNLERQCSQPRRPSPCQRFGAVERQIPFDPVDKAEFFLKKKV